MRQSLTLILTVALLFAAAACTSGFMADVTRFHRLPKPDGETIEVAAKDAALQQGLAFQQYATLIGERLGALGYKPPEAGAPPTLIARIDYGSVSGPAPAVEKRSPVTIGVGIGGGGGHTSMGVGLSTGLGERRASRPAYERRLSLQILRRETGEVLYEGTAANLGESPEINAAMPRLIEALFRDFPGKSGATDRITLSPRR